MTEPRDEPTAEPTAHAGLDKTQLILAGIALWEPRIALMVQWGIKSWHVIRAAMADAGADDAIIAANEVKLQALIARFHLLSGAED